MMMKNSLHSETQERIGKTTNDRDIALAVRNSKLIEKKKIKDKPTFLGDTYKDGPPAVKKVRFCHEDDFPVSKGVTALKKVLDRPQNTNAKCVDPSRIPEKTINVPSTIPTKSCFSCDVKKSENDSPLKHETDLEKYLGTIQCKYEPGDVVWAKITGYSFWPAMVDRDPDTNMYFWVKDFYPVPTHYHVVFFDLDSRLSRSWCKSSQIKLYGVEKVQISERHYRTFKVRFCHSVKQAEYARTLTHEQRLNEFSFAVRSKQPGTRLCHD